jgi:hypothetical protein
MYRIETWFSPEHGYALKALRTSILHPAGEAAKWEYLPDVSAEWSDPVDLEEGIPFYRKCHMRLYEKVLVPDALKPENVWAYRAYDLMHWDFTFSKVQINKPLDPALFDVQPIAGTNVIDEPKGYLYVVGNAGEELHKTALAERDRRPQGDKPKPAASWRTALLILNVTALLALTAYWLVLRKRKAEKKP